MTVIQYYQQYNLCKYMVKGIIVEGLKRFNDNHFDLAIVDPPYGIGFEDTTKIIGKKETIKALVVRNFMI